MKEAAKAAGISLRTAYKWLARFRKEGRAGLMDRSSRSQRAPSRAEAVVIAKVIDLRRLRLPAMEEARQLNMPISTAGPLRASSQERAEEEKAMLEKHWGKKYPKLVNHLEEHFNAVLAVLNMPVEHRKRLLTTNHVDRVNQELKRRGWTVRIWPNPASRDRLYGRC